MTFGNNAQTAGQAGAALFKRPEPFHVATNLAGGYIATTLYGPNNTIRSPGLLVDTAIKASNPTTAFLNADGALTPVLSFLNDNFDATVLSTPRAVTPG